MIHHVQESFTGISYGLPRLCVQAVSQTWNVHYQRKGWSQYRCSLSSIAGAITRIKKCQWFMIFAISTKREVHAQSEPLLIHFVQCDLILQVLWVLTGLWASKLQISEFPGQHSSQEALPEFLQQQISLWIHVGRCMGMQIADLCRVLKQVLWTQQPVSSLLENSSLSST